MTRALATAGLLAIAIAPRADPTQATPVLFGASVSTSSGLPVLEINCARFEVRVDAVPRPLATCTRAAPLTIALLLDTSGSFDLGMPIRDVVEVIASRLRRGDRLAVGWFGGGDTVVPAQFTSDRAALADAADRARRVAREAAGPSPLWDALSATNEALARQEGRRICVVLTDGDATGNLKPFAIVARDVVMSGIEVHAVGVLYPSRVSMDPERAAYARLGGLALASGGTVPRPAQTFSLEAHLRALVDDLQRGYLLGIDGAPHDGEIHRLSVRIASPGFRVRAPDRLALR